jgi:hypothetical protein
MKHFLSFLLFVSAMSVHTSAQLSFEKIYGGKGDQYGYGIAITGGGYAVCGHTALPGSLITDAWVLLLDQDGDTVWTRQYGGDGIDDARSVMVTTDSSLVICGTWSHTDPPKIDFLLMKITMEGDTVWTRKYFSDLNAYGYSVAPASDGFILCGYADSGRSTPRMMIVRVDTNGDKIWARLYGDTASTAGFSAVSTTDGGVIACGYKDTFSPSWNRDIYLVRTDGNGDTLWTRSYPTFEYDVAWCISQADIDGYIITGYKNYMGMAGTQLYILRIDGAGNVLWEKNYGQSGLDIGYSGMQISDGGFIFCGESNVQGSEYQSLYLVRTNPAGDTLWTRMLGGYPRNSGACVRSAEDGGFIICGGTTSISADGLYDLYIVKTHEDGTITSVDPATSEKPSLELFPNPSEGVFNLVSMIPVIKAEVFDMSGKSVYLKDFFTDRTTHLKIVMPPASRGLYILRITTLQGTTSAPVFIR